MSSIINILIIFFIGYFIGSLPYGYLIVKIFKKQDIREMGSKNIGATNVLRAGYKWLALITFLADFLKGFITVTLVHYLIFPFLMANSDTFVYTPYIVYASLAGLGAILGHIFPIWLKFKGGKGVSTTYGTLFAINPIITLILLLIWLIVAIITKYSSLAAIISFCALPIATYFLDSNLSLFMSIITLIILIKHKTNIKRLIHGTETKIIFRKKV